MLWVLVVVAMQGAASTSPECHAAPTLYDCAVAQVEHQEFPAAIQTLTQILATAPSNLKALNLLGIALTNAGRAEEASTRFQRALAIDPDFLPARKNLAINEFARGKLTEAQRDFELVLARTPDDEVAHLHLGEIAYQRKQPGAALPHYEKAHARVAQSRNAAWILHYAACLLDRRAPGKSAPEKSGSEKSAPEKSATEKAVALLDQLPRDDAASAFEAGVLLGRAQAYRDAARFFAAARAGSGNVKDAYAAGYNQVLMLVNAGDGTAAIHVADELFARGPEMKRAELYSLVAQAYLKTERIKEAYDALREATRLEPNAVEHYVDLAMICVDHQNFDLGLEIVAIGLKYRPESSLLYLQRGVLFAMKGSIEEAATAFDQASKVAPDEAVPYVAQSMIWMQTGQAAKAVDVLRTQTQARARAAAAANGRAKANTSSKTSAKTSANVKEGTRARETVESGETGKIGKSGETGKIGETGGIGETGRIGEKDAVLFYALGVALLRGGASPDDAAGTEAMNAFATAVRLSPDFPQARAELGKLLMKRGDTNGAIAHLEKAVALDPENAAPAYVLAQAYRKRGDVDRARDQLSRVSTINTRERGDDPDHELKRVIIRIVREGATPKSNGIEP